MKVNQKRIEEKRMEVEMTKMQEKEIDMIDEFVEKKLRKYILEGEKKF